jgi:hypothetical protein
MITFLLVLMILFAISPILLAYHKKVKHKKLLVFAILLLNFQSLSTIVVPALFTPELFDGPMFNYLILAIMYYILIFLFYLATISFMPINNQINIQFLKKPSKVAIIVLLSAIFFFSVLVVHSNGIFLTNPRLGYQAFREGFGSIWVFYITAVSVLFYIVAIKREINLKKIFFFTILMYFTGSKKLILDVFIKSLLVYLWSGKKIKKWQIVLAGFLLIVLMLKLFGQFGASQDFLQRVKSYFDFMYYANKVFTDYANGTLEHTYGSISLSGFWSYVPRAIYPDKPFAYGSTTLVEMYMPGLAATGHTPSFGMFTAEFVDFGWFAPLFSISSGVIINTIALSIIVTNANVSKNAQTAAMLFILAPGYGFHLPLLFSFILAYFIVPSLFVKKEKSVNAF